ncbi:MAG TPA: lantibiotic dehydratase, partial [Kofleriaceae bacterium]|nr:lantibiotic dehydratase [Kofleriaceae bacterium]
LLAACDGVRPARAIAEELAADPTLELDGPDEVYELLDELVEQKLLLWTIEISPVPRHPEAALRRALEAASGPACERGLEALRELERGRDAVRAAAGRPAELAGALAELDATFEKVTDHAPVRRDGEFYAGRTLLYELGTRDVELELGGDVLARLGPPLALVLASARWFTWHVGQRYLAAVHAAYRALRDELGDPVVPYLLLWQRIAPLFPNGRTASPIVTDVSDELRRRWMDLLAFDPAERRVQRTAAALRDPVEEAFGDAPGPGWPWARHQSPDLMIAACSAEAIARGEYTVVLGELHSAMHSYLRPLCIEDVPHRDRLIAAYEADIERGCVFPVTSRSAATAMDDASMSRADYELVTGDTPPAAGPARALAVGELCAAEEDGRLVVRTRDGRARLQAAEYLSYYLSAESMSQFKLLPDATHLPRVEIDGLVIARERWTFEADQLTLFRRPAPRLERFVEARRWARTHDLPRRVFVTIPEEIKPMYVDLESPVYVELFSRLIRNASRLTVTEMLPGPDECWLVDASGARYTSELRVAAVDPEPWRPR